MLTQYIHAFNFIILSFGLGFALLAISSILRLRTRIDREKSSIYVCGFIPFSETRYQFEIQFYSIAILFLLFDIEVLYLYPFSINYSMLTDNGLTSMFFFLLILIIGVVFEIKSNILNFFEKTTI